MSENKVEGYEEPPIDNNPNEDPFKGWDNGDIETALKELTKP